MGELAAVGVALAWAVSTLIFSGLGVTVRPLVLAAVKCTGALVLMALTLAVTDGGFFPAGVGAEALGILALSGLLGLTLGDSAHFLALVRLGPRRTLILAALSPVATALLAALFLSEPVGLATALGIALTLGGVGMVLYERLREARVAGLPGRSSPACSSRSSPRAATPWRTSSPSSAERESRRWASRWSG